MKTLRRFWLLGVVITVLMISIPIAYVVGRSASPEPTTSTALDQAEAEMFRCLQPMSQDDAEQVRYLSGAWETAAGQLVYKATCDFRSVPSLVPMTIWLPHGTRWLGGQLGYINLVTEDKTRLYYDGLCELALEGQTLPGDCTSAAFRRPASTDEMMRQLRRVTLQSAATDLKGLIDPLRLSHLTEEAIANWYVIVGNDVRLAPLPIGHAITIWYQSGQSFTGGQLGDNLVIGINHGGVWNTLCKNQDLQLAFRPEDCHR